MQLPGSGRHAEAAELWPPSCSPQCCKDRRSWQTCRHRRDASNLSTSSTAHPRGASRKTRAQAWSQALEISRLENLESLRCRQRGSPGAWPRARTTSLDSSLGNSPKQGLAAGGLGVEREDGGREDIIWLALCVRSTHRAVLRPGLFPRLSGRSFSPRSMCQCTGRASVRVQCGRGVAAERSRG